jgi:hypothetical protein
MSAQRVDRFVLASVAFVFTVVLMRRIAVTFPDAFNSDVF